MAHWLVSFKNKTYEKLYKCSNCGIVYKEVFIKAPKHIDKCPNCNEMITGAAVDHSDKYTKEKVEEMFKIGEETQKIADECKGKRTVDDIERMIKPKQTQVKDQSIPGIYERHMMDILDYLQAKFPQLGKDELMEAVGCISNRTMVVVQDMLYERDREWKRIMRQQSPKVKADLQAQYKELNENRRKQNENSNL